MSRYSRGPPPDTSEMVSLKVDNLTYRTSADDIEYLFEKYGKIGDVFIPKDKFTRESRGFAFVRFYDKRDAEDAMDALDGRMYDGRDLRIQMAKYGRPDINRWIRINIFLILFLQIELELISILFYFYKYLTADAEVGRDPGLADAEDGQGKSNSAFLSK